MVLMGAPPDISVTPPPTGLSTKGIPVGTLPLSSTQQRPQLLAFFGGQPAPQWAGTQSGLPPTPGASPGSPATLKGHFSGLRDEGRRLGMKSQFVKKASTVAFARKVATTLATFLPTCAPASPWMERSNTNPPEMHMY